jgi:LAS superfamily LD-carboxypeptidase LdcB
VATWQSRRSNNHSLPAADRLMLVGCEEFFDPERPEELRHVERQAYQAYRKMMTAAAVALSFDPAAEKYLKIISAFRSPEYQRQLRRQSPRVGRAALARRSPHFNGRALDLFVGGDPVSTENNNRLLQTQTKAYRWLVKNAESFGFYPYFYEPWHWEYQPQ